MEISISANNQSSPQAKIALFRSFFRGREEVYPKRFENKKTGKSGYVFACGNEWVMGIYPMLLDETCFFLAADFDKASWTEDATAFLKTCHHMGLPAALEAIPLRQRRSRLAVLF